MAEPLPDLEPAVVTRTIERPTVDLWQELAGADFDRWMGPGSTIDPTPDGELIAADPDSGVPRIGRVLEVEPGRRIRWAWRPLGDDPDGPTTTEVVIEVTPVDDPPPPLPGAAPLPAPPTPATVVTVIEYPTSDVVVAPLAAAGPKALATAG